jgi:outer membrane receptor protein involved in Fe transport
MNGFRISALLAALLAGAALNAAAQTAPADPAKPAAAAKKDGAPAAKKAAPAQKPAATPAKKTAEKKAPAKKVQKEAPKGSGPVVERYKAGEAPNLQGPGGSVIQTSPDAYNIDSAKKK